MSEGLAQGPYVADREGVEPMTLWTKGVDSTKVPPSPTQLFKVFSFFHKNAVYINTSLAPDKCI